MNNDDEKPVKNNPSGNKLSALAHRYYPREYTTTQKTQAIPFKYFSFHIRIIDENYLFQFFHLTESIDFHLEAGLLELLN